ncbi:hypothetical protein [Weizmannia acidilactici]|nr:hypothetical protein [Weizmannia acidilactici]
MPIVTLVFKEGWIVSRMVNYREIRFVLALLPRKPRGNQSFIIEKGQRSS